MEIFADTANLQAIKRFVDMGILDGVTTNPTLLAKEGREFRSQIDEIVSIVEGPVNVEVISTEAAGMVKEGRDYAKIAPNIVVKCPMTAEGLKAVRVLNREGIRTNVTLIFSPNQALLAAKAGAKYVSPFIGRLDDAGHVGMEVVADTLQIYRNYGIETKVLAASIRHPVHVVEAAKLGAHIATMPPEVLDKLLHHPLTDLGLGRFLADWEKAKASLFPDESPKVHIQQTKAEK